MTKNLKEKIEIRKEVYKALNKVFGRTILELAGEDYINDLIELFYEKFKKPDEVPVEKREELLK